MVWHRLIDFSLELCTDNLVASLECGQLVWLVASGLLRKSRWWVRDRLAQAVTGKHRLVDSLPHWLSTPLPKGKNLPLWFLQARLADTQHRLETSKRNGARRGCQRSRSFSSCRLPYWWQEGEWRKRAAEGVSSVAWAGQKTPGFPEGWQLPPEDCLYKEDSKPLKRERDIKVWYSFCL